MGGIEFLKRLIDLLKKGFLIVLKMNIIPSALYREISSYLLPVVINITRFVYINFARTPNFTCIKYFQDLQ